MVKIRIEAGGLVLKSSGSGYVIGRASPRMIKGKPSERVQGKTYRSTLWAAILAFSDQVLETSKKRDERVLAGLLMCLVPILTNRLSMRGIISYVRESANLSKSALARGAGVSRSTIKDAELHGADLRSSTLIKILHYPLIARW